MPRSWTPVVSCQLAFAFPGLLPSVSRRTSAFPACAGLSFQTTKIIFSELGHAACTLATPGFIHTLMDMHAGSLQFQWLTFTGGNLTVTCLHPLGSNIQFHNLLFDPTDLNLLDTIVKDFGTSQSPKSTRSSTANWAPAARRPLPCDTPRWFASHDNSHQWLDAMVGCLLCFPFGAPAHVGKTVRPHRYRRLRAFASLSLARSERLSDDSE
jgi:hypothetical protein